MKFRIRSRQNSIYLPRSCSRLFGWVLNYRWVPKLPQWRIETSIAISLFPVFQYQIKMVLEVELFLLVLNWLGNELWDNKTFLWGLSYGTSCTPYLKIWEYTKKIQFIATWVLSFTSGIWRSTYKESLHFHSVKSRIFPSLGLKNFSEGCEPDSNFILFLKDQVGPYSSILFNLWFFFSREREIWKMKRSQPRFFGSLIWDFIGQNARDDFPIS